MAGPQWVVPGTLKRNAKMSLAKLGNSKDSHFECRVLFNWSAAPDIGVRLRRVISLRGPETAIGGSHRNENSSVHFFSEPDFGKARRI